MALERTRQEERTEMQTRTVRGHPRAGGVPDGSRRGGQGADEVGHGVWNVDGQGRDVGLHGLHWRLGCLLLLPLLAGQGSERDLDVCAREPERAPEKEPASGPGAGLEDIALPPSPSRTQSPPASNARETCLLGRRP